MAVRVSMNELTTYRWSFDEDVQQYAAAGHERYRRLATEAVGLRRREGNRTAGRVWLDGLQPAVGGWIHGQ